MQTAAIRNPPNESRRFTLDLATTGCPSRLSDAFCYTQYPYRKGIADGVAASSKIALDLAPWELLFLEILPRPELVEPVALGARWYRDANGRVRIADGAGRVRPRVCLAASTCREDHRQWLGAATSALGGKPRQQLTMAPGPEVILDKSWLKSLSLV